MHTVDDGSHTGTHRRIHTLQRASPRCAAHVARPSREPGAYEYLLSAAGKDLRPVIETFGIWGQRWIETGASLNNLDPNLLMWDMRRNLDTTPMPAARSVIQVIFSDQAESRRNWWLIVQPGEPVDLCWVDPGFDIDLYLVADLRTLTEIWMGYTTVARAKDDGRLISTGSRQLDENLQTWLGLSPFARIEKFVA